MVGLMPSTADCSVNACVIEEGEIGELFLRFANTGDHQTLCQRNAPAVPLTDRLIKAVPASDLLDLRRVSCELANDPARGSHNRLTL